MFTSFQKLLAAATVLGAAVQAVPAPAVTAPALAPRADATDAWVTVDKTGQPSTVTPVVTVSDGTSTTISAIPTVLTATVLTRTEYGELTTSSGTAAAEPTASNQKGKGSFLVCSNTDGEYAPFCEPTKNSSLYPGTTYYITWDSSALNATQVKITGTYINSTTGEEGETAFTSDDIKASWSYYAWTPGSGDLRYGTGRAVNVSLALDALASDGETVSQTYTGPTVLVTKAPTYHQASPTVPSGAALYIGLPVILGFCLIMVCGVCAWNRKTRRIDVGNIMSRGRRGYGVAKSRAKRMTLQASGGLGLGGGAAAKRQQRAMHSARLMENVPEDQMYRDEPRNHDGSREYRYDDDARDVHVGGGGHGAGAGGFGQGRRDSDGLGSLAGTPTSEHFSRQQGGNAFRDELERQRRERY